MIPIIPDLTPFRTDRFFPRKDRERFMRASNYYRGALAAIMPGDPGFPETAEKCRKLMSRVVFDWFEEILEAEPR